MKKNKKNQNNLKNIINKNQIINHIKIKVWKKYDYKS